MHSDYNDPRPDAFPTSISALQFPSGAQNLPSILSLLKRSTLSPHNRLRSIQQDSHFVQSLASRYGLPLVANERCGSWYIPPKKKTGSVYFKSTDGHFGQWAFSSRRLNLQILEVIGAAADRCVIVDSTRRGKSMPDALSKTVPIWCVVLNRLLFPERLDMHGLWTPESSVGASEHAQMVARVDRFVQEAEALQMDIPLLRARVRQPLVPSWITPGLEDGRVDDDGLGSHNRIICATASRRVNGTEASENGYIQGAADDHEGWSQGLTPALFWEHEEELLSLPDEAIPEFVRQRAEDEQKVEVGNNHITRIVATNIFLGTLSDIKQMSGHDAIISICSQTPVPTPADSTEGPTPKTTLHVPCKPGKLGSRALRNQLHYIINFLTPFHVTNKLPRILIACPNGKDLSVGVALAVLCTFYDDDNNPRPTASAISVDKTMIRRRLAQITAAKPDANPSRATLQSVHAFLMPGKD